MSKPTVMRVDKGPLAGTAIALIEKAGYISITQAFKHYRAGRQIVLQEAIDSQIPTRVYLRHPIKRLISAWRYFYPHIFPNGSGVPPQRPLSLFIDDVLRDVRNEHWNPQLARFADCNITEIFRFENIADNWPYYPELPHLNKSTTAHPGRIEHRIDELRAHYAEDLSAWHESS